MEIKPSEEPKEQTEVVSEPSTKDEKPSSSAALVKLVILVVLGFVAIKYGVPLMNQISEKSTEAFEKKEEAEKSTASDVESTKPLKPDAVPSSDVRITEGFATWEPAVREQVELWIREGADYKLLSIDVNDSKDTMEIRYTTHSKEGQKTVRSREKIVLKKDGFGDRFIYTEGDKEFLVRPPQ